MFVVCGLLFVVGCLYVCLFVSLCVVRCSLFVAGCVLLVARCLLFVVFVVCCLLFVVCCPVFLLENSWRLLFVLG